jgi:hypothetical protein
MDPNLNMDFRRHDARLLAMLGFNGICGGRTYFVHSGGTAVGVQGAMPTIQQALAACTSGQGDVIIVLQGHTETVDTAAELNFNKKNVRVIGIGEGRQRPMIDVTATGAYVALSARGVYLENLTFRATVDNVVKMIDVTNADCVIKDCSFINKGGTLGWLIAINSTAKTAIDAAVATTPWKTLTSATGGFTADMVGRILQITAGTSFTTGAFEIVTLNSATSVTVDRAMASGDVTDGTFYIPLCSDLRVEGCEFITGTVSTNSATCAINLDGTTERVKILNNDFFGRFANYAIVAATALHHELKIESNRCRNETATAGAFLNVSAASSIGVCNNNLGYGTYSAAIVPGGLACNENFFLSTLTLSGTLDPASS